MKHDKKKKKKTAIPINKIYFDLENTINPKEEQDMLCPITGNIIKLDFTGAVERNSVQKIKNEIEMKELAEMKHFRVRYKNRNTNRGKSQKKHYLVRITKELFSEHYFRKTRGNQNSEKVDEGDEIEFATNWVRAFQKIYTELKWLNAFAIINSIAVQKILKKFMKVHFQMSDNIVDKNIQLKMQSYEFIKRSNLQHLMKDFKLVIADFFTDGSLNKA